MTGALLATAWTAMFLYLVHRLSFFHLPGLSQREVGALFLLKVAGSAALWAIYTFHYTDRGTADVFKYFDDSAVMHAALSEAPRDYLRMITGIGDGDPRIGGRYYMHMNNWYREYEGNLYNDAHTMIRFNALIRLVSFGHFGVHGVIAAFLSFLGACALFRSFQRLLPGRERLIAAALFLLPSVLFWGSGVIKESLLFLGLGLLVGSWMRLARGPLRWTALVVLPVSMYGLFFLKFYVLLSLLPGLLAWAWCERTGHHGAWWKFLAVHAGFVLLGLNFHHLAPGYHVIDILWIKQKDFIGLATSTDAGSFVMPEPLERNGWSFVRQAPHALLTTLVGPLLHPGHGAMGWAAALENALVILALALLLARAGGAGPQQRSLALLCLGYVLVLSLIIGWTTPVMGAVVRYRVPLLPFLFIGTLALLDPERIPFRTRTIP